MATDNAPVRLATSDDDDTDGVRVAAHVISTRGGTKRYLFRGMLRPDSSGHLEEIVHVPIHTRRGRICAEAYFVTAEQGFHDPICPIAAAKPGRAVAELRPIRPRIKPASR